MADGNTAGHGGERAQQSNAEKTSGAMQQGGAALDSADRHPMPDSAERESANNPAAQLRVAEEPSGYRGDDWSTAGPGGTGIRSSTPENAAGHLNPSAPGDTGTTPGTTPE